MVNKKLVFAVLLFALQFSEAYTAFNPASDGCDGCKRTAVLKGVTGDVDSDSFTSRLVERVTTPCFHLLYSGKIKEPGAFAKWKPPEYYFTASYENNLPGKIKSRLNIILYFEDGEFIHNWKTESDRPTVTFHWHLNNMFNNPGAVLRQSVPLELTLLNDFEKRPEKCDVKPDKEELFPGQEIQVKISNIVDFEGRKSREFNRIVVQAVDGVIIGGTPLASDPDLKAFQVGKEGITFTYVAPDDENSQAAGDKIVIYNSCDILRKDEYPMEKTSLKDKIAEKKIKILRADAEATVTTIYKVHTETHESGEMSTDDSESSEEIRVIIKSAFEYDHTYSDEDEDEYEEHYSLISSQIISLNGTLKGHSRHFDWDDSCVPTRCTFERIQNSQARAVNFRQEDEGLGMTIIFNAKTHKATEVAIYDSSVNFTWVGKAKEKQTYNEPSGTRVYNEETDIHQETIFPFNSVGAFQEITKVRNGDSMHKIGGGGSRVSVPGFDHLEIRWEIVRHRK